MKTYRYSADGGSVAIACGNDSGYSIIRFPNDHGDGSALQILVFDNIEEFNEFDDKCICETKARFLSYSSFYNAKVLDYDCYRKITDENVLFTLTGNYMVYARLGDIYFVKW